MVMDPEPNTPAGIPDPRAPGDTPADKALSPHVVEVQNVGLPAGAVPGDLTAAGFAKVKANMSPGGEDFVRWVGQLADSPNGCIDIQTGFSNLDQFVIETMIAAGYTAGWNGGQVLVGKDAASYFNALSDVARNRLALLMAAKG